MEIWKMAKSFSRPGKIMEFEKKGKMMENTGIVMTSNQLCAVKDPFPNCMMHVFFTVMQSIGIQVSRTSVEVF